MSLTYGSDFWAIDDIDPNLTIVTEFTTVGQAMARRISCPRGNMIDDGDYGIDVRSFIGRPYREVAAAQAIENEALKDERVDEAWATVTFVENTRALTVELKVRTARGPFTLVLDMSDGGEVTAQILQEAV
jgi:hypothetical protein